MPLFATALSLPCGSTASAAVTIGSDLSKTVTFGGYGGAYMGVPATIPGQLTTAPFDGMIVRWRVKGSANWGTITLRVMRRVGVSPRTYTGAGTSASETPGFITGIRPFSTDLPIHAGDYIGLQATSQWQGAAAQPGAVIDLVNPIPSDGGLASPAAITNSDEPFFNADVERELTSITDHPKARVKTRKKRARVSFAFSSNQPGLGFACSLDGAPFAACSSPASYRVGRGHHTFQVETTQDGTKFGDVASFNFKVKHKKRRA